MNLKLILILKKINFLLLQNFSFCQSSSPNSTQVREFFEIVREKGFKGLDHKNFTVLMYECLEILNIFVK